MAPNVRNSTLVADDCLTCAVPLIRLKVTTSRTPNIKIIPASLNDGDFYWTWTTDSDEDVTSVANIFSESHIQANLEWDAEQYNKQRSAPTNMGAHDEYWAEASSSESYWDWRQETTASDKYWAS